MEVQEIEAKCLKVARLKQQEAELAQERRKITAELSTVLLSLKNAATYDFSRCKVSMRIPTTYKIRKGTDPMELKDSVNGDVLQDVFKTEYKIDAKAFKAHLALNPALLTVVEQKEGAPSITVEVDE